MNGLVRTVLGDVDPTVLGITYCHEHLIVDSAIVAMQFPHIHLPSVDEAVAEVTLCRTAGVGAMVDAMPEGGRDLQRLREVSRRTGLHVISATGLHMAKYYERPIGASAEELADRFLTDIASGCGVIKVAIGPEGVDERARLLFQAAAITHADTGAPIITHCEDGEGGFAQVDLLVNLGVPADRVVLSHTDKVKDAGYHRDLLETGVNLEYDQALRQADFQDQTTAMLLVSMVGGGFIGQLMLGTDGARRTLWKTLGGSPGLSWLLSGFVPILEGQGIDEAERRTLLIDNPARWLTFS
jgi:phosphotriesterase-related protein